MSDYIILTDSSCDLPDSLAKELEIKILPLYVNIGDKAYANTLDGAELNFAEYYNMLREGVHATTSAANINDFTEAMEPVLASGCDVLYLGFSSGLSSTFSASTIAAEQLSEKYPDRKVITVDTLGASLGQGLIVYLSALMRKDGKTIEEVADFVNREKLHTCHFFTVDDLNHLKRGGRISAATAAFGTVLSVKPIMHVDNEGHLVAIAKVMGRKNSLRALADKMAELVTEPEEQTIFISHGDCLADAELLADFIRQRMTVKEVIINYVGPVIGTHSGPGTIALFFMGKNR